MNVIQLKDASLYPNEGGHWSVQTGDHETHFAYMVLGRADEGKVLVMEGSGATTLACIEHLMRQVKLLRDWMDIACHGSFWQEYEAEAARRMGDLREAMGLGRATPTAKKDDDNGLS
jgi:hypothetical protein